MTDELLPALPEPSLMTHLGNAGFTDDQMHAYAREAIRLAQAGRVIHRPSGKCCSGKASPPAGEVA